MGIKNSRKNTSRKKMPIMHQLIINEGTDTFNKKTEKFCDKAAQEPAVELVILSIDVLKKKH